MSVEVGEGCACVQDVEHGVAGVLGLQEDLHLGSLEEEGSEAEANDAIVGQTGESGEVK